MRYKVDTLYGYASFDESEKEKALEYYEQEGFRLWLCKDLHDEGEWIAGLPPWIAIQEHVKGDKQ